MKHFKKLTGAWTSFFVLFGMFGIAWALQQVNPQYHNQGQVGSSERTWNEAYIKDIHNTERMYLPSGADAVTPYGTQFPPNVVTVNSYTQLTAVAGASVYVIDPTLGSQFDIDLDAIYESCTPAAGVTSFRDNGLTTGISVVGVPPSSANDRCLFTINLLSNGAGYTVSGVSTVTFWVPQTSGVTSLATVLAVYPAVSGESIYSVASSVSDYALKDIGESRTYQNAYESEVSFYVRNMIDIGVW